jgi:HK97 family phage portal protein
VTTEVDPYGQFVTQYSVDGIPRPMSGLGSLVTIQSFNEGILTTGARTIQAAIDVQKAAAIAAGTPMATGYIRNSGADLPPAEVQGLLAAWKSARQNRSTAYLTSTLQYEAVGFSPKDMLYNEAIQNLATEISRLAGIPAYYLSADMNTSMTYANIIDERKQLVALAFQPYISAIEQRLSMDDISTAGHYVKFDLDSSFLRVDPMERLLVLEKMLALGLITTEQAMEMEDLTPNGSDD